MCIRDSIGLIEVMGLAILPARLKKEMELLKDYILNKKDIRSNADIEKHADLSLIHISST